MKVQKSKLIKIIRDRRQMKLHSNTHGCELINLIRMFIEQFLEGNKMAPLKIHNGRYYAHAKVLNAYNFCFG